SFARSEQQARHIDGWADQDVIHGVPPAIAVVPLVRAQRQRVEGRRCRGSRRRFAPDGGALSVGIAGLLACIYRQPVEYPLTQVQDAPASVRVAERTV